MLSLSHPPATVPSHTPTVQHLVQAHYPRANLLGELICVRGHGAFLHDWLVYRPAPCPVPALLLHGQHTLAPGHPPWYLVTPPWSLVTPPWSLVTPPWSLVPPPWSLVTPLLVPGHPTLVPGHPTLVPGHPSPGTWSPHPGTWSPHPGTWSPHPGPWSPHPGTWSPHPGTWSPHPGTWSPHPGTWSPLSWYLVTPLLVPGHPSPGTWSPHPGTWSPLSWCQALLVPGHPTLVPGHPSPGTRTLLVPTHSFPGTQTTTLVPSPIILQKTRHLLMRLFSWMSLFCPNIVHYYYQINHQFNFNYQIKSIWILW